MYRRVVRVKCAGEFKEGGQYAMDKTIFKMKRKEVISQKTRKFKKALSMQLIRRT